MNAFVGAAENARCRFVNFKDYFFRLFTNFSRCGDRGSEGEEAVFIHGAHRNHRYVHIQNISINRRFVTVHHGNEVAESL